MIINYYLRIIASMVLCAITFAVTAPSATNQPTFHVVSYMNKYDQPSGLVEGSPGVFYSEAGQAPQVALSITPQGSTTILASFSNGYQIPSLLVSAANGRFYSSIELGTNPANVFSVSSVPGSRLIYTDQSLDPILAQNLPQGDLLAVAVATTQVLWSLAKVDLQGTVTSIYQFPSGERLDTAIYASDGNYYGVFQTNPAGTMFSA